MDSFAKLMGALGTSQSSVDFIAVLPVEIAELILLKLDPHSLLNAVRVSRKWMNVCKGSSSLKKRTRLHLQKTKRNMVQDNLILIKQKKKQKLSKFIRMQTDLAQRIPKQGIAATPVFGITGTTKLTTLNKISKDKKPISSASLKLTKCYLKLR